MTRGWNRLRAAPGRVAAWAAVAGLVVAAGCGRRGPPPGAGDVASPRTNTSPRTADQAPFSVPVYDRNNPSRVVALLTGSLSRFALSSQQMLDTVRVDYYDNEGRTNLSMTGTNCTYDARGHLASSPGVVRVRSGDGQLDLEGEGFTWWQTNNDIVLSNRVITVVRRPESRGGQGPLRVGAGGFRFNYGSNLIVYSDGVRVEDARMRLACRVLTLVRSGNTFERILAEGGVVIEDATGAGRATAREAVYVLTGGEETVELTGDPRWEGGGRLGMAGSFVLDRKRDVLRMVGSARLVLPVGGGGADAGGFALPVFGAPAAASGPAGRSIEVTAATITFQLPETNGPVRSVVAETNVVLLDLARDGRLVAGRVEYGQGGQLDVTGSPVWTSGQQRVSGGAMHFDGRRQAFVVEPDARVRLAVGALARPVRPAGGGSGGGGGAGEVTNHFIEVRGPRLEWRESWLRIENGAKAEYYVGEELAGRMSCRALGVQYSNVVQQVTAAGDVVWEQLPRRDTRGRWVARSGRCASVRVGFDGAGNVREAEVSGGVAVEERVRPAAGGVESVRQLRCGEATARFTGPPYRVEGAVARGAVKAEEGVRMVEAEVAQYDGSSGWLELTGHPVVRLDEGRIWDATVVGWEPATGKYRMTGRFKSRWKALPTGTNLHRLLPLK